MSFNKNVGTPQRTFWTPLRLTTTLLVFGLLLSFGLASCNSHEAPTPTPTTKPGTEPAGHATNTLPATVLDAEQKSLNGNPIKLSAYSGKVLLVNLWATWCGPCRNEIPELVKLYKEFKDQGFEVVGLSTENPDSSREMVRDFVRAYEMNYAVGWVSPDVAVELMQGNGNIPQSFLITRDGRVVTRFVGFSSQGTPPKLRKAIEDALKT
jgi:glutathione peroxidase-family protein